MSQSPQTPYDPTQHYSSKLGFRGVIPPREAMESSSWDVDGPDVIGWMWFDKLRKDTDALRTSYMADPARPQPPMVEWGNDDEEATPRPLPSSIPQPSFRLQAPSLTFDLRISLVLSPAINLGATPSGYHQRLSFPGGLWTASFGSGTILPGNQDIQVNTPSLASKVLTTYILQTHDDPPAHIIAKTSGWKTGPRDVLEALGDPVKASAVDPASYNHRLFINLETGDERYAGKVNGGMWIGSGVIKGTELIYDAYRVG